MSTEPPTLQAVLDALANFHRAFGTAPGMIGTILQIPGEEAEQRWRLALDLMVRRGVHPGSAGPTVPSDDLLSSIEAWLGRGNFDAETPGGKIRQVIQYVRTVKAKSA